MKHNTAIGQKGEQLAVNYLKEKGYTICCCNFRYKNGEIDIIAQQDGTLVFIEVKYRRSTLYGFPEESVQGKKIQHIMRTAEQYITTIEWDGAIRFDIVSIVSTNGLLDITHLEDAFY